MKSGIRVVKGNLLDLTDKGCFDAIGQGCNCYNAMAGELALQIANRWPEVQKVDSSTSSGDKSKLGKFSKCEILTEFKPSMVYNLYTQFRGGPDAKYLFVKQSLENMFADLIAQRKRDLKKQKSKDKIQAFTIGLPLIGAGIGGLEADQVKFIIREVVERFANKEYHFYVSIVEFDPTISLSEALVQMFNVEYTKIN